MPGLCVNLGKDHAIGNPEGSIVEWWNIGSA